MTPKLRHRATNNALVRYATLAEKNTSKPVLLVEATETEQNDTVFMKPLTISRTMVIKQYKMPHTFFHHQFHIESIGPSPCCMKWILGQRSIWALSSGSAKTCIINHFRLEYFDWFNYYHYKIVTDLSYWSWSEVQGFDAQLIQSCPASCMELVWPYWVSSKIITIMHCS